VTRDVGRFPSVDDPGDTIGDPAKWAPAARARAWDLIARLTGETPEQCRDLAGALGLIDQPVWRELGKSCGAAGRKRIR
jgi:hypothetical protein